MSEGMWDGVSVTLCPHGNYLNLGDRASCGCQMKILTAQGTLIGAGPYAMSVSARKLDSWQFPAPYDNWIHQAFENNKLVTVGELLAWSASQIRRKFKSCGPKALALIEYRLLDCGVALARRVETFGGDDDGSAL